MTSPLSQVGSVVDGRYRIDSLLGKGGMGAVYRARDLELERDVAIKLVRGDRMSEEGGVERFKAEAVAMARVRHKNVGVVYDFGTRPGGSFIVMELIDGIPLRNAIRSRGKFEPLEAAEIAVQICLGVGIAHEVGVVHRDIKPHNILLETSEGRPVPRVVDFGIALLRRPGDAPSSGAGVTDIVGTPAYMAPEQCAGLDADARADVYSLGCVLYEMLVGRTPFSARSDVLYFVMHMSEEPAAPSSIDPRVPPELDAVVARALAKSPEDRFDSMAEMAAALWIAIRRIEDPSRSASGDSGSRRRVTGGLVVPPSDAQSNPLPRALTSFIGREVEVETVVRLVGATRLLTLTGTGGVGKTRLALVAAERLSARYRDGVRFVDLATTARSELVVGVVAAALDIREGSGQRVDDAIVGALRDSETLLVLDNCERVLDGCAPLVDRLLRETSSLDVLATSREPLNISGEVVWSAPGLDLSGDLAESDAVRLFVDRAIACNRTFALSTEILPTIVRICERLDGLPLAIELAAARVRVLSLAQIEARLDDRFRLLTGGRTAGGRPQTLWTAIESSFELLDDLEKTLFDRFSVFAGGWDLEAAEHMALPEAGNSDDPRCSTSDVLNVISALVDKSLVIAEVKGVEVRYRMLETIREFGSERLRGSGAEGAARSAHCDYYSDLARRLEPELLGVRMDIALDVLQLESANLRQALEWTLTDQSRRPILVQMSGALYRFWLVRGLWTEGLVWLRKAIEAGVGSAGERAKVHHGAGALEHTRGNIDASRELYTEGLALAREACDRHAVAAALNNLGAVAHDSGDLARASTHYEEAASIFRDLGEQAVLTMTLVNVAQNLHSLGQLDRAESAYSEALEIATQLDHRHALAQLNFDIGRLARDAGDYDRARALYESALDQFIELGYRRLADATRVNLGELEVLRGRPRRAASIYKEAASGLLEQGDEALAALLVGELANFASVFGRPEAAMKLAGAAEAHFDRLHVAMQPPERMRFESGVASSKEKLGEARAERAFEEGKRLDLEGAFALAFSHK